MTSASELVTEVSYNTHNIGAHRSLVGGVRKNKGCRMAMLQLAMGTRGGGGCLLLLWKKSQQGGVRLGRQTSSTVMPVVKKKIGWLPETALCRGQQQDGPLSLGPGGTEGGCLGVSGPQGPQASGVGVHLPECPVKHEQELVGIRHSDRSVC